MEPVEGCDMILYFKCVIALITQNNRGSVIYVGERFEMQTFLVHRSLL